MEKKKKGMMFLVDDSVLIQMLEGVKPATETGKVLDKLTKADPGTYTAMTTSSALLRAIHESSKIADMSKLKDILETIKIVPTSADFKDEKAVREEMINFAKIVAQIGEGKSMKRCKWGGLT